MRPSQLTSEKLVMRMMTPVISMALMFFRTKVFSMAVLNVPGSLSLVGLPSLISNVMKTDDGVIMGFNQVKSRL